MSMFLNENTGYVPKDVHVLEESGIVSFIKKFYTGKDDDEIKEYKDRFSKANGRSELENLLDDIRGSIEDSKDFLNGSTIARFFGHGIPAAVAIPGMGAIVGVTAAGLNMWFKSGKAKSTLLRHIDDLQRLHDQVRAKLDKTK